MNVGLLSLDSIGRFEAQPFEPFFCLFLPLFTGHRHTEKTLAVFILTGA